MKELFNFSKLIYSICIIIKIDSVTNILYHQIQGNKKYLKSLRSDSRETLAVPGLISSTPKIKIRNLHFFSPQSM